MVIKFGDKRGDIDRTGHLKVLLGNEGIFIRVIAITTDKKRVIGTLANNPITNPHYSWGDLVLAKETNSKQLATILRKTDGIPNTNEWHSLKTISFGGVF